MKKSTIPKTPKDPKFKGWCVDCTHFDPEYHILYEATQNDKYKDLGYCKFSEKDDSINQTADPYNWCEHFEPKRKEIRKNNEYNK